MSYRFIRPTGPSNPGPALFDGPPTNCRTCLHGSAYACNLLGAMRSEALVWRNANVTGTGCPGWEAHGSPMLHGVRLDDPLLHGAVVKAIDGRDAEAVSEVVARFALSEQQATEVLQAILIQDGQRAAGCFFNAAGRLRMMGSVSEMGTELGRPAEPEAHPKHVYWLWLQSAGVFQNLNGPDQHALYHHVMWWEREDDVWAAQTGTGGDCDGLAAATDQDGG